MQRRFRCTWNEFLAIYFKPLSLLVYYCTIPAYLPQGLSHTDWQNVLRITSVSLYDRRSSAVLEKILYAFAQVYSNLLHFYMSSPSVHVSLVQAAFTYLNCSNDISILFKVFSWTRFSKLVQDGRWIRYYQQIRCIEVADTVWRLCKLQWIIHNYVSQNS